MLKIKIKWTDKVTKDEVLRRMCEKGSLRKSIINRTVQINGYLLRHEELLKTIITRGTCGWEKVLKEDHDYDMWTRLWNIWDAINEKEGGKKWRVENCCQPVFGFTNKEKANYFFQTLTSVFIYIQLVFIIFLMSPAEPPISFTTSRFYVRKLFLYLLQYNILILILNNLHGRVVIRPFWCNSLTLDFSPKVI